MSSSAVAAPFKLSLGTKRSSPATNSGAKAHSAFGNEHDSDGDDNTDQGEHITTFDPSGKQKSAPPRVIQGIPNRDWREESKRKRQKSGLPREAQAHAKGHIGDENKDVVKDERPAYGLTFVKRSVDEANETTPVETTQDSAAETQIVPVKQKTADEEALDALLGNRPVSNNAVIAPPSPSQNEDDVFKSDFRSAPPPTTAEQYEATPVEGFGAALLRGYLNPGETLESRIENHAKSIKEPGRNKGNAPKKRPGLLGIGAKESGLGVELGAWGKAGGAGKGQNKNEPGYNPLVRKNRNTGEVITEDELKEKMEAQKGVSSSRSSPHPDGKDRRRAEVGANEEKRERSERRYDDESGHRHHERDRDRHRDPRRDRSRSADKNHRRRHHDETDAERRERKDRERHKRDRDRDDYHSSHGSSRRDDQRDAEGDRKYKNRDRRR